MQHTLQKTELLVPDGIWRPLRVLNEEGRTQQGKQDPLVAPRHSPLKGESFYPKMEALAALYMED